MIRVIRSYRNVVKSCNEQFWHEKFCYFFKFGSTFAAIKGTEGRKGNRLFTEDISLLNWVVDSV